MNDEKDLWDDESTKPKSNWFEFDKVGDSIRGDLIEVFEKKGKYGIQKVYIVKVQSSSNPEVVKGDEYNVALKETTHKIQIQQLKRAELGDVVGFKLREFVDVGKGNPAKSIEVRIRHVGKGETTPQ